MGEITAKVRLGEGVDTTSGRRTIWADIINVGEEPINRVLLTFEYEYENPQDISNEFNHPPGRSIRIEELGRQIKFQPALYEEGPLPVGDHRAYLLSAESVATLESVVASLSPERYRLAITINGLREVAVPGMVVGGIVQRCTPDSFARNPLPLEQKQPQREVAEGATIRNQNEIGERMPLIRSLIARIKQQGQTLEILPPRELTHSADIFGSKQEFHRLEASRWSLKFHDECVYTLSFTELMAIVSELMMLRWQYEEFCRTRGFPNELPVVFPLDVGVSRWMVGEEMRTFVSSLRF